MTLSTLQLASTSVLTLLASSTNATQTPPLVLDEPALSRESSCTTALAMSPNPSRCAVSANDGVGSHRLPLDLSWKTKRTASDVLTDLLDVDGIRVVADRHLWDRPDNLALRHDFASDTPFHLYCAAGIDRAVYLDSRTLSPSSPLVGARRERSVSMMAELGASWRLTRQLDVESDIHWVDLTRDARLLRTDAGWISGDPAALTLTLVWHGR